MVRALLLLAVVGCLFASAAARAGDRVALAERIPFETSLTNPCTGETFSVTGFVHHRFSETTDEGSTRYTERFSFESVDGWTESGVRYHVPGANSLKMSTELDDTSTSFSFSFRATERFIRVGNDRAFADGDDLITHIVSRFDVDADGSVRIKSLDIDIECG